MKPAKSRSLTPNAMCAKCGSRFYASPGHKAKGHGQYCSLKCRPVAHHGRGNGGVRPDLGFYVRSTWEANYARYLKWLVDRGEIQSWEFEPERFEFFAIRFGTRSYIPDFRVIENDGSVIYHEVKGWMDDKSRIKLKRMRKYYPAVKIIVIDHSAMKHIARYARLIPHWERMK